jgi:hypothetical protein
VVRLRIWHSDGNPEVVMSVLSYVRMVLWSFFGIRRSTGAAEELTEARLLPLVLTAVAAAALFAGTLITVALFAAGRMGS